MTMISVFAFISKDGAYETVFLRVHLDNFYVDAVPDIEGGRSLRCATAFAAAP